MNKKSQALSELAIFGTLIVVAFAAVLFYIQSMNSQQALQMKAFRQAIALSQSLNKEVTYTIVRDTPLVDFADLIGRPSSTRQVVSSRVMAMSNDTPQRYDNPKIEDRDSYAYYDINGNVQQVLPIQISPQYPAAPVPVYVWMNPAIVDNEYTTTKRRRGGLTKTENAESISTNLNAGISTSNVTVAITQKQDIFLSQYNPEVVQTWVNWDYWEKAIYAYAMISDFIRWFQKTHPLESSTLCQPQSCPSCSGSGVDFSTGCLKFQQNALAILKDFVPNALGVPDINMAIPLVPPSARRDELKPTGISITEYIDKESFSGGKTFSLPSEQFKVSK